MPTQPVQLFDLQPTVHPTQPDLEAVVVRDGGTVPLMIGGEVVAYIVPATRLTVPAPEPGTPADRDLAAPPAPRAD